MDFKPIQLNKLILQECPRKSDAIVWLQGDRFDRGPKVVELYKNGWANKIILTGNDLLIGSEKRDGENNISLLEMQKWLLKKGLKKKQIIIERKSLNTKEQAQNTIKLAKKNRWNSLIIVGSSYCQPRSFLTFLKQAKIQRWNGIIRNQSVLLTDTQKPGGRTERVSMLKQSEFKKTKAYKKDMVNIKDGLEYLRNCEKYVKF